jgi:hypothetical protein
MSTHPTLPGKWYVSIASEARALVGSGAGPFDTERQARDWLLCLPLIKGAAVWRHAWPDRRTASRHAPAGGTVCRFSEDRETGLVWNVSEAGAGLIFREPLPTGASVSGELTNPAGDSQHVTGRVRHSARLRSDCYLVGCQFDAPLTESNLRPFLSVASPVA